MKLSKYLESIEDLSNKKIALTGATSGIGKEFLFHLLSKNAQVVILVRESPRVDILMSEVKTKYPNSIIEVIHYDQSSIKYIEKACDELVEKYPDIDDIVLDAGILSGKGKTVDNYPITIGINYIGVRHFIDYISPKLKKKCRFVIQGSIVAGINIRKPVDLYKVKGMFRQYNISKIYLEAYFYKLFTENKYKNIEYVLTEPGISATGIIRHMVGPVRFLGKYFLKAFFHSPKIASLPLLVGVSNSSKNGDFIRPRGLFTMGGYPKIQEFPKKRRREYLLKENAD